MANNIRNTQEPVEVDYTQSPKERITQEAAEVGYVGSGKIRNTQEACEVSYIQSNHIRCTQVVVEVFRPLHHSFCYVGSQGLFGRRH